MRDMTALPVDRVLSFVHITATFAVAGFSIWQTAHGRHLGWGYLGAVFGVGILGLLRNRRRMARRH